MLKCLLAPFFLSTKNTLPRPLIWVPDCSLPVQWRRRGDANRRQLLIKGIVPMAMPILTRISALKVASFTNQYILRAKSLPTVNCRPRSQIIGYTQIGNLGGQEGHTR